MVGEIGMYELFDIYDDMLCEECGVFGILGYEDVSVLIVLGLYVLQYCGQEVVGIVIFDNE